jgi:transcriptional regulator with XRE-family HTH domain
LRDFDMTLPKAKIRRPFAPDYVDASTLAYRLSVSESTVEKWEREGRLPPRRDIFGIQRWKWAEIEDLVDGRTNEQRSKFVDRLHA